MKNIYYLFSVKDQYFTDLSAVIRKRYPNTSFYGLAYAKTTFLKNSIYNHISFVSDLLKTNDAIDISYLTKIEEVYGINIAMMIHADRHLMRYAKNRRLIIAQVLIKRFIQEMREYNISLILAEAVDDFISYFATYYCRYHAIPFYYATYVGYDGRACFSSNIDAIPNGFSEAFYSNLAAIKQGTVNTKSIEEELTKYVSARKKPSYFTLGNPDYKAFRWEDISRFFKYIFTYYNDRNGMHYDRFPLLTPFYRLQRIMRKRAYKRFIAKSGFSKSLQEIKYLIYPLHFEPEASTLIQGRWFNDQKKLVEMISKNLPTDTILILKEHKASVGRRPLQFYKDITQYHNVFMVDDTVDSFPLVEYAKGVVVISSTMGLEALMQKKPVMIFGERFYNVSANVYPVLNYKSIYSTILKLLKHEFDWQDTLAIFYTIFEKTENLGCIAHFDYSEDDLSLLVKALSNTIMRETEFQAVS